jgi:hypothetical protein
MPLACKICLLTRGLRGADIGSLPTTQDELNKHIEDVHHMPVLRDGEDEAQATARFVREHPGVENCADCREKGAPWAVET